MVLLVYWVYVLYFVANHSHLPALAHACPRSHTPTLPHGRTTMTMPAVAGEAAAGVNESTQKSGRKKATFRWLSENPRVSMLRVYKLWGKRKPVLGQSKPVIVPILWVKTESSSFIASANSVRVIKPDAYICKCAIYLLCKDSSRFCFCSRFKSMIYPLS